MVNSLKTDIQVVWQMYPISNECNGVLATQISTNDFQTKGDGKYDPCDNHGEVRLWDSWILHCLAPGY